MNRLLTTDEWLRDLERMIKAAVSRQDREVERKMAAIAPGASLRVRAPTEFKVTS